MTARIARWSLVLLTIFLLAAWWPVLKDLLFEYRFGKTQLFYSPVLERFIYTELIGEGHQFIYRDQDGKDYDRQRFETLIPFIYYKNMELWGKLPLQLGGQTFDKAHQPIAHYERTMAMAEPRLVDQLWAALAPFRLELRDPNSRYFRLAVHVHGISALPGMGVAVLLAWLLLWRRGLRFLAMTPSLLLVALSGFYGLLALLLFPPETMARHNFLLKRAARIKRHQPGQFGLGAC